MGELEQARSEQFFASPVLVHRWSDAAELNPSLRDGILAQAWRDAGASLTNVGGWHSAPGTLAFCGPAGERLLRHVHAMTEEATHRLYAAHGRQPESLGWTLSAWANVNRRGHFNKAHTHPGATWSGVYYVDGGDTDPDAEGTALHLSDPCPTRSSAFFPDFSGANILFRPEPGLMIMFPSYLPHAVPPHAGDGTRISVAFNVRKDPFP